MIKLRLVAVLLVTAAMVSTGSAEDPPAKKKKKGNQQGAGRAPAAMLMKQLSDVELTEDQKAKIKEMGTELAAKMKTLRSEAGLTPALNKKMAEVGKAAREEDKKGAELRAAVNAAAGLSENQLAAMKQANELTQKFRKEMLAMLTDEQKAALPAQLKKRLEGARGKGHGKQKKEAA